MSKLDIANDSGRESQWYVSFDFLLAFPPFSHISHHGPNVFLDVQTNASGHGFFLQTNVLNFMVSLIRECT